MEIERYSANSNKKVQRFLFELSICLVFYSSSPRLWLKNQNRAGSDSSLTRSYLLKGIQNSDPCCNTR